jgi:hypothetical protein
MVTPTEGTLWAKYFGHSETTSKALSDIAAMPARRLDNLSLALESPSKNRRTSEDTSTANPPSLPKERIELATAPSLHACIRQLERAKGAEDLRKLVITRTALEKLEKPMTPSENRVLEAFKDAVEKIAYQA